MIHRCGCTPWQPCMRGRTLFSRRMYRALTAHLEYTAREAYSEVETVLQLRSRLAKPARYESGSGSPTQRGQRN